MATTPWAVAPFVVYLVLIAVLPQVSADFWARERNKLIVAAGLSLPVLVYLFATRGADAGAELVHTALDYGSFMALLGALFTVSSGITLRGALAGSPSVNLAILLTGAVLSSLIGTTGASVLLIRPLLRANLRRASRTHVVVFFIFIVSNIGGLLTPLGDPPLFLGFLRGVPFTWTLRLWGPWAFMNGALLALFALVDRFQWARERGRPQAVGPIGPGDDEGPLRVEGGLNLLWLLGVVLFVFTVGALGGRLVERPHLRSLVEIGGLLVLAILSFFTTAPVIRERNRHSWSPLLEVAAIFVGVFITMIPALSYLTERGATLGILRPAQFFWASGLLSSVLDNAPTYLAFASLATGVAGGGALSSANLGGLAGHPTGATLLGALSCGSVMMGALTYLGNGPNFMVKAIAERHGVRMPSFFGYLRWSCAILLPLLVVVSLVFFG